MTRRTPVIVSLLVCAAGLAACGSSSSPGPDAGTNVPTTVTGTHPTETTGTVAPTTTTTPVPTGPSLSLAVEPVDRYGSVNQLIKDAAVSLDLTLYRLVDPQAESLLVAAHHHGVAVRALLDHAGSAGAANLPAYSVLQAGGIPVRWAPDSVVFHQSTITADHDVSAVMTGGPTAGSASTRGYVAFDREPTAVASIESVFTSDWSGAPVRRVPAGVVGLVWSPGAKATLVGLIASARRTLAVECGQLAPAAVVSALRTASRHGVKVTLTMTADPQWDKARALLSRAGVRVATYPAGGAPLVIRATAVVVDNSTAFVGSQLFTSESLLHDRELGLTTRDPAVVAPLTLTLAGDFAGATPLGGATPAGGTTTTTGASG